MPRKESVGGQSSAQAQQEAISEGIDSFELPRSLVTRIARSAFPDNIKLQKETVTALLKGSTVFVNYLAATAHDVAASKQHKSVSASDVLKALELTQFGDLVDKLQDELQVYRDLQKTDKSKKAASKAKGKDTENTASTASKPKGKGKDKEGMPPNSTTNARTQAAPPSDLAPDQSDDGEEEDDQPIEEGDDEDMVDEEDEVVDGEEDEGVDGEEEQVDEDEEVEDEEDPMVVEEEEVRRDAKGLEARNDEMED